MSRLWRPSPRDGANEPAANNKASCPKRCLAGSSTIKMPRQKTYLRPEVQLVRSLVHVLTEVPEVETRKYLATGVAQRDTNLLLTGDIVFFNPWANGMGERWPSWAVSSKGRILTGCYIEAQRDDWPQEHQEEYRKKIGKEWQYSQLRYYAGTLKLCPNQDFEKLRLAIETAQSLDSDISLQAILAALRMGRSECAVDACIRVL